MLRCRNGGAWEVIGHLPNGGKRSDHGLLRQIAAQRSRKPGLFREAATFARAQNHLFQKPGTPCDDVVL